MKKNEKKEIFMKKNGKKIAIIVLLAIIAVGSYFISGTYAKYSRGLGGSGSVTVAKFAVTASGLDKDQTAEIDLFKTINEEDTTTAEENVAAGKIAPGTGGQFTIDLTNDSEVDVEAVVKIEETANESNVPIEYSLDGTTWDSAANTTDTIALAYKDKTGGTNTGSVTVYWRWRYNRTDDDTDDQADTEIGEKETVSSVTTKVTVTFTQVD